MVNGSYVNKTTTNYQGRFNVAGDVRSLTFIRPGYETLMMNRGEVTDTILLLPSYHRINEVVVYGKLPGTDFSVATLIGNEMKNRLPDPNTSVGISVGGKDGMLSWLRVFEKGHVSEKKRRERMKAIENY